jgi:Tol biopolymer transport system component
MRQPRSSGFGNRPRPIGLVLALALLAGVSGPMAQAAPAPGTIERVSVAGNGTERNQLPTGSTTSCAPGTATSGNCSHRTISEDGLKVVFTSRAPNIVDGDNNNAADIFLAELSMTPGPAPTLTSVKRVSVISGNGAEGNGDSESATISPNGQWIAFESKAANLGTDADPIPDVFVYRVSDGALFLATPKKVAGAPGNSFFPSVADNGTVAYTSYSTWLAPGGNGGYQQVFVTKDPAGASQISMVSVSTDPATPGAPGAGAPSKEASISADGLKVAFNTGAKNIGPSEGANVAVTDDVAVRNLTANTTARVTTGARTITPAISPDGNKVTFSAEGPIGADNDPRKDVYVVNSDGTGTIQLVSACTCGGNQQFDRPVVAPQMNNAGNVVFQSAARFSDVRSEQVWLSGTPALVSKSPADAQAADAPAELPSINGDGSMISFTSAASNLVPSDLNGSTDVFVAQMAADRSGPVAVVRVSQTPTGKEASGFATEPTSPAAVSGDGNIVAFDSDSSNLVPGDTNGVSDIFVRDRAAGTTTRVSVGAGGAQADGSSFRPAINSDGSKVVFESVASNLIAGDTNQVLDIFLLDRNTGEIKRVSNGNFGESNLASRNPSISPNGRWIAFESASDLANSTATKVQVYRYDTSNPGTVQLVSKANKTPVRAPDRDSTDPSVADDGSVAFLSLATKLASDTADPRPNAQDVFVARPSGEIIRATTNNDNLLANGDSFDPAISADGSKVAFSSLSDNLPTAGSDRNPDLDVFVRDLGANRTTMVSVGMGNAVPGGLSLAPAINADGSLVAFVSRAGNLVPGDGNGVEDVFLASLGNGGMERVSVRPGVDNGEANNRSYTPSLSANGLVVVFKSSATNLVDNDNNGAFDTFVRRLTGVPQPGAGGTFDPNIKGLGYRFVAADGGIFSYDQQFYGSAGATKLNRPIVGMAATPSNGGYWLVATDGGIFSYGDAKFLGSAGDIKLNSPIVGMAATPSGNGYWFVAADGGIFAYGDAAFEGSMGGKPLNRPIVAMAATKTGKGYWLVASDGGIFSFGDATFFGSTGDLKLNKPIVGMDRSNGGNGYRFVASDGGIFSFGDAKFLGSAGDLKLNKPIVGMARTRLGDGYWLVASDGGVFSYGDAQFYGSTGAIKLNSPIVGLAS